tara:strand:- start:3 stop:275 length:273 start_codon:yes stop_codon:yes gene_type:complete
MTNIESDLRLFCWGKGEELCDAIADRLNIEKPAAGWPEGLTDTIEEELKDQIHNDSEAIFQDYMDDHGAAVCTDAFEANYEAPEEEDEDA